LPTESVFHLTNLHTDVLTPGNACRLDPAKLFQQEDGATSSTKAGLKRYLESYFKITTKGYLLEWNSYTTLWEEASIQDADARKVKMWEILHEYAKATYRLYKASGLIEKCALLLPADFNLGENEGEWKKPGQRGVLPKFRYNSKAQYAFNSRHNMLLELDPNVEDEDDLKEKMKDYLPIAQCRKVCLKTGAISDRTPDDYFKFCTGKDFDPDDLKTELLGLEMLGDMCIGSEDLRSKLLTIGYIVTDRTNERGFIMMNGSGRNGKSVLLSIIAKGIGRFATSFGASMIRKELGSTQEGHSTNLLAMKDVRLSSISELNPGDAIDTSKLKTLSGDDAITARKAFCPVRHRFFNRSTIVIATNSLPDFGNDDATYDRIIMMQFPVRFADPSETMEVDNRKVPVYEVDPVHYKLADPEKVARLENDPKQIMAFLVHCAIEYNKALELSGKSAILRELMTEETLKMKEGMKAYDLDDYIENYIETIPKYEKSINQFDKLNDKTMTKEAFENGVVEPLFNQLKTSAPWLVSQKIIKDQLHQHKRLRLEPTENKKVRTTDQKQKRCRFYPGYQLTHAQRLYMSKRHCTVPISYGEIADDEARKRRLAEFNQDEHGYRITADN
jgi:phage/plasmid-associated DNA primase